MRDGKAANGYKKAFIFLPGDWRSRAARSEERERKASKAQRLACLLWSAFFPCEKQQVAGGFAGLPSFSALLLSARSNAHPTEHLMDESEPEQRAARTEQNRERRAERTSQSGANR